MSEEPKSEPTAENPHDDVYSDDEVTNFKVEGFQLNTEVKTQDPVIDEEAFVRVRSMTLKKSNIEIKVHNPVEVKGGAFSSNYITYEVVGKDRNGKIESRRRFKEFEAVYNKLKRNYPGIFIPSIPDKTLKNKGEDVIQERTTFLDYFLKKCSKVDHIFYSDELQLFLHSSGDSDDVIKNINNLPQKTCATIFAQYNSLFPEFDKPVDKEQAEDINKKIAGLKEPLAEVIQMRELLKKMRLFRPDMKKFKADFLRRTVKESLPYLETEEKSKVKDLVTSYNDNEKADDLGLLLTNLKMLRRDIESFLLITNDFSFLLGVIGSSNGTVQECTKEINSLKASDKDMVADGLFKKVKKEDKIRDLEKTKEIAQNEYDNALRLKSFMYNMLDRQEIPLIIFVKNYGLAQGVNELAKRRIESLRKEEEILDVVAAPYLAAVEA
jgi:PX domain